VFNAITLRGAAGEILWGYRPAATLRAWLILRRPPPKKKKGERASSGPAWELRARTSRVDGFQCRQKPLYFSAPRRGGFWCWPVLEVTVVAPDRLIAKLGPPEQ